MITPSSQLLSALLKSLPTGSKSSTGNDTAACYRVCVYLVGVGEVGFRGPGWVPRSCQGLALRILWKDISGKCFLAS